MRDRISNANSALLRGEHALAAALWLDLFKGTRPPLSWRFGSNYLLASQYDPEVCSAELKERASVIAAHFPFDDAVATTLLSRKSAKPLRVGFVSADLCDHPVGFLLLPLLLFLDRNQIAPILYAAGTRRDGTSARLQRFAEWREIDRLGNDELIHLMRGDQLDVAIDLSGHTGGNRLPVFAARVAPVQISWLGYSATTGVDALDAIFLDEYLAPIGSESQFTERLLRLPTRWCYNPLPFAPEVQRPPFEKNGFVTFGSFNSTAKYNERLWSTWADILRRTVPSRLILKWPTFEDEKYAIRVIDFFRKHGVGADRVELRGQSNHRDLLHQYGDVDIALDPYPFTGGYTTCEAMWMGLPVITLAGDRAFALQSRSIISATGVSQWLDGWIAETEEGYIAKAVQLAEDLEGLQAIRREARGVLRSSLLMDGRAFSQSFTSAVHHLVG